MAEENGFFGTIAKWGAAIAATVGSIVTAGGSLAAYAAAALRAAVSEVGGAAVAGEVAATGLSAAAAGTTTAAATTGLTTASGATAFTTSTASFSSKLTEAATDHIVSFAKNTVSNQAQSTAVNTVVSDQKDAQHLQNSLNSSPFLSMSTKGVTIENTREMHKGPVAQLPGKVSTMREKAGNFITSFREGISRNKGRIATAGAMTAFNFITGLSDDKALGVLSSGAQNFYYMTQGMFSQVNNVAGAALEAQQAQQAQSAGKAA